MTPEEVVQIPIGRSTDEIIPFQHPTLHLIDKRIVGPQTSKF